MFQTINPVNNELLAEFPQLTDADLQRSVRLAEQAFRWWKFKPVPARAEAIRAVGHSLSGNLETYARLITLEMGKPIGQSEAELKKCISLCEYFADHAEGWLTDRHIPAEYSRSFITWEPLGTILGIMPWNFPFWQALRFAIPAMLAGNVVIHKPAPNVPQCGRLLEEIFAKATENPAVFQTVFAGVEQVPAIVQDAAVQGVALTGSDRAGAQVASLAGLNLKKCVLELGGSDAFVVLSDADLTAAAHAAVLSRMNNTGQTCIAAKRFIVQESAAEDFITEVQNNYMQLCQGDPFDPDTILGPMARPDLSVVLQAQVDDAVQQGARVLISGGAKPSPGNFFRPMLLSNLVPGMRAYREELFGPVGVVAFAKTEQEAIEIANATPYGLGAAVWSSDIERALAVARQLEVGTVAINDFVRSDPRFPFGGVKRSGFGRELGPDGLHEFTNVKTIYAR
jgi:succinate-semialdehyde dehydrogenase/glutarate-semialdehyde dehydrogenase